MVMMSKAVPPECSRRVTWRSSRSQTKNRQRVQARKSINTTSIFVKVKLEDALFRVNAKLETSSIPANRKHPKSSPHSMSYD